MPSKRQTQVLDVEVIRVDEHLDAPSLDRFF